MGHSGLARRLTRHLLAALVVVGILFLIPVVGELLQGDNRSATPTPTAVVTPTVVVVETLTADLDQFWRDQFAITGADEPYIPPAFVFYDPSEVVDAMACDQLLRQGHPGIYCSVPRLLYLNRIYLDSVEGEPWSQTYLGIILAHEWGHHIRYLIDPTAPEANAVSPIPLEVQAFCAAGLWAQHGLETGLIDTAWLDAYRQELAKVSGEETLYGSGDQLLAGLDRGLAANDPSDCDYSTPFAAKEMTPALGLALHGKRTIQTECHSPNTHGSQQRKDWPIPDQSPNVICSDQRSLGASANSNVRAPVARTSSKTCRL